jgi:hypothetical protein
MRFIALSAQFLFVMLSNLSPAISTPAPIYQHQISTANAIVRGRVLTATGMPMVRMRFSKAFKYVGSQKFVLYDVANAEQFFFVDADRSGHIRGLFWIQFEGYLPNNKYAYDYPVNKTVRLGGLDFIADAFPVNTRSDPGRSGSDGILARAFLESKGYRTVSDELILQRLVFLTDQSKRSEIMIIYLEDLSAKGLTAADLRERGKEAAQWNKLSQELLDRALKNIKISVDFD